jgi:hypothetical protein
VRELPIHDGWRVHDDNLLATTREHQAAVFAMLSRQPLPASFVGGFEAARFTAWHVEQLAALRAAGKFCMVFFAYDTADDWEPLIGAVRVLAACNWPFHHHRTRCYILCGYPGDTLSAADARCRAAAGLGLFPQAMPYRAAAGLPPVGWRRFARAWTRPALINALMRRIVEEPKGEEAKP